MFPKFLQKNSQNGKCSTFLEKLDMRWFFLPGTGSGSLISIKKVRYQSRELNGENDNTKESYHGFSANSKFIRIVTTQGLVR